MHRYMLHLVKQVYASKSLLYFIFTLTFSFQMTGENTLLAHVLLKKSIKNTYIYMYKIVKKKMFRTSLYIIELKLIPLFYSEKR